MVISAIRFRTQLLHHKLKDLNRVHSTLHALKEAPRFGTVASASYPRRAYEKSVLTHATSTLALSRSSITGAAILEMTISCLSIEERHSSNELEKFSGTLAGIPLRYLTLSCYWTMC